MTDPKPEAPQPNPTRQAALPMGVGIALGAALGAALGNVAIGVALGIVVGGIGVAWRRRATK
jgi:uncharacterized membrane protein